MAYTPTTPDALEAAQLAAYANRFPGRALSSEDFLGKLARAEAQGQWSAQLRMQRISLDAIPQSGSSFAALSDWSVALGLPNGAGEYGPKVATAATGGIATATGTNGSMIASGAQLVASDGVTMLAVTANATISAGTAAVHFAATTPGAADNLGIGSVVVFVSPPSGVQPTVSVTTATTGGDDGETDTTAGRASLLARIEERLRNTPKVNTPPDLRAACEGAGAQRAYVYPRHDGTGTALVVCTQDTAGAFDDGGAARIPGSVAAEQAALTALVDTGVEGYTAAAPASSGDHTIAVRIIPTDAHPFDWDSTGATWTVAGWNSGTRTLTLNNPAPVDLVAGCRIAVITTGVVIPVVARVATVSGADLEFAETPVPWIGHAPQVGDAVHGACDATVPIALALRDGVYRLGPSKVSGYADAVTDTWPDSLSTWDAARIALDVTDGQGLRFLASLQSDPILDGGSAALRAPDDGVPAIVVLSAVVVKP